MIGSKQIVIDAMDVATRGMSTTPESTDGAFSPETTAINLLYEPGAMHIPADAVTGDSDATLSGNIIASSPDMNVTLPTNRLFVTDSGKYYSYNGAKLSAVLQTDASGNTYAQGFTDIITYAGEAYVTSKEKITRWQNPSTFNNSFFSFTNSNVPHPAIVYENSAYYADKNLLLQQTSAGGTPTTVLTLSVDQVIMSLGIDPGSGLMLISTTNALDISSTLTSSNKLLWYDGNSLKVSKSAFIDDVVLGFHTVGTMVLVGYGNNIGYVNGSGITWLRKLTNVTYDNTQLPYKHKMTHIGHTFYVLNGLQVYAYGEIFPGRKIWYPAFNNTVNSNKPSIVANVGNNKLGIGFATSKFYTFDTVGVGSTGGFSFYANKSLFTLPIFLREVRVFTTPIATTGSTVLAIGGADDNGAGLQISIANRIRSLTAGTAMISFLYGGQKLNGFQLNMTPSNDSYGIKRIVTYYDPAE